MPRKVAKQSSDDKPVKPKTGLFVTDAKEMDIIVARGITCFKKHPGNSLYRDLVLDALAKMKKGANIHGLIQSIIECMVIQRGGRFLIPDEHGWRVMEETAIRLKILYAIKNAERKAYKDVDRDELTGSEEEEHSTKTKKRKRNGEEEHSPKPPKRKQSRVEEHSPKPPKRKQNGEEEHSSRMRKPRTPAGLSNIKSPIVKSLEHPAPEPIPMRVPISTRPPIIHEAREGSTVIPTFTLKLISFMCNQSCPEAALVALDAPLEQEETDSQRQTRLQLRQRYIAAMSIGMSPLTFSKRLMGLWGGNVLYINITHNISSPQEESLPAAQK